jgi:sulfopyruvate decarboxylase subunit beta
MQPSGKGSKTMIRSDVLKTLVPLMSDQLVVANIGLPSQELHLLDDQPTNFYMLGTMGLASSIGLGAGADASQEGDRYRW